MLPSVGADNRSFQNYLKSGEPYTFRQQSELTTVASKAASAEPLLSNWGVIYIGIFSDWETLDLSTDLCKINGIVKLYYNALVTSQMIIRFLLNVFSCPLTLRYLMVFTK